MQLSLSNKIMQPEHLSVSLCQTSPNKQLLFRQTPLLSAYKHDSIVIVQTSADIVNCLRGNARDLEAG